MTWSRLVKCCKYMKHTTVVLLNNPRRACLCLFEVESSSFPPTSVAILMLKAQRHWKLPSCLVRWGCATRTSSPRGCEVSSPGPGLACYLTLWMIGWQEAATLAVLSGWAPEYQAAVLFDRTHPKWSQRSLDHLQKYGKPFEIRNFEAVEETKEATLCVWGESAEKVTEELNMFQSQAPGCPPSPKPGWAKRYNTRLWIHFADLLSYFLQNASKVYGPEKVANFTCCLGPNPWNPWPENIFCDSASDPDLLCCWVPEFAISCEIFLRLPQCLRYPKCKLPMLNGIAQSTALSLNWTQRTRWFWGDLTHLMYFFVGFPMWVIPSQSSTLPIWHIWPPKMHGSHTQIGIGLGDMKRIRGKGVL